MILYRPNVPDSSTWLAVTHKTGNDGVVCAACLERLSLRHKQPKYIKQCKCCGMLVHTKCYGYAQSGGGWRSIRSWCSSCDPSTTD